jgi:short-subunit dehydrogenase
LADLHDEEGNLSTSAAVKIRKRALVTGASSGIGAAIARELATLGVDLVLTARRRDALEAVAATCKGVKVEIVIADLGKPDAARALWDAAIASGPIDILINNAAFVRNFSEGLHDEHRGTPLSVTCICPGGTETAFHAASGGGDYSWIANASTKSAEFVAHAAIRAMLRGKRTVVPGLFNKLSCFFVRFVTRRFASRLATQVLGKPRFVLPARGAT